jgi:hypothetical protein
MATFRLDRRTVGRLERHPKESTNPSPLARQVATGQGIPLAT